MLFHALISISVFLCLQIVNTSCREDSAIAFAIDTTGSMRNDIEEVKRGTKSILNMVSSKNNSTVKKFVLVAINDPWVKILANTTKKLLFQKKLNKLTTIYSRENNDCPEQSLTGIQKALETSGSQSHIYMFTDSNAKDYKNLANITSLCQKKQSQVVIVFSVEKNCYYPGAKNFTVYYEIAKACSGQVFIVGKEEVNLVLKTIKILLQGRNSIFKWTRVPKSNNDSVKFTLDEKAEYAMVSASGTNVSLRVTTVNDPNGAECKMDSIMWARHSKFVMIPNTKPGSYYVWVTADSATNVVVYGRTDFTFDYGFFNGELDEMESLNDKQPLAGSKQKLLINVNDLDHSVDIKSLQIYNVKSNEPVSEKLLLEYKSENFYITDAFVSPTETFRIQVEGIIRKANESIIRNSANIDPRTIPPKIKSTNRNIHVIKGSKIELTCNVVEGYPKPRVLWYKKKDTRYMLLHKTSEVLTVDNALFTHASQYKCIATNDVATDTAIFDVTVTGLPEISVTETNKEVPYDSDVEFTCKVESYPPPTIVWKDEKGSILQNEGHKISKYEFYNKLNLPNVRRSAVYTCEANNTVGSTTEDVKITVPSPFQVKNINRDEVEIKYGNKKTLTCDIKSTKPMKIRWYRQTNDVKSSLSVISTFDKYTLSGDDTELTIKSVETDTEGTYICEASLLSVPAEKVRYSFKINVVGRTQPRIQSTNKNIQGMKGGKIELPCKIVGGIPKPQVKWFKKNGESYMPLLNVSSEILTVNEALFMHAGQYQCVATNEIANDTATFDVIVSGLPEISVTETNREVSYDSNVEFTCKVESYPTPRIEWKDEKGLVLQSKVNQLSKHEFYSKLNLPNVRRNAVYTCEAINEVGSTTEHVKIAVPSPFKVKNIIHDEVEIKYGNRKTLTCDIKSTKPMKIQWYRQTNDVKSSLSIISSFDKYTLSGDDTELTIKSVETDTEGTYICEASLLSVPSEKVRYSVKINVVGRTQPKIQSTNKNVQIMKEGKIELPCKIVGGIPKPQVKWFKKNGDSYMPLLNVSSEILTVNEALFAHAGQYQCVATNEIATDTATFDVIVSGLPEISVTETNREVPYDSNVEFTCKVESYPTPRIVWKDEKGLVLQSKVNQLSKHEFYSKLNLPNVRRNAVYTCEAINEVGSTTEHVKITVPSPFKVKNIIHDEVEIKYGNRKTLTCDIKSTKPMKIRWYRQKNDVKSSLSVISSFDKYTLSGDDTELTIKSVETDTEGTYICEASLLSVPTEKVRYSVKINVVGRTQPRIQSTSKNIQIMKGGKIELPCKIVGGIPKPQVKWFKKNGDSYMPLLNVSSEILTVNEALFAHDGQYQCVATNEIATDTATFDVIVSGLPEISVTETNREVPYDSNVEFTCKVESYPTPSIVWKDEKGLVLQRKVNQLSKHEFYSKLNLPNVRRNAVYTCEAINEVGSTTEHVKITVPSPFKVKNIIHDEVEIKYGNSKILTCDIKSTKPMKIRWYRQKNDVKSSLSVISSFDKYTLSGDDTELTIKSVETDTEGTYICEASLLSVPTEKVRYSVKINVVGRTQPMIQSTSKNIQIMKGGKIELPCKIVGGIPKPQVKWFKKNGNSYMPLLNVSSEILTVNEALFTHAGQYQCLATNEIANDTATYDVSVSGLPEISVTETNREVPYDSDVEFTCKVKSYPPPSIIWKNEMGSILQSKVNQISKYEFYNKLKLPNVRRSAVYTCEAINKIGSVNEDVNMRVPSPFLINNTHRTRDEIKINYGSKKSLSCDIKSTKPMKIQWYRQENDATSSRSVISSSDKYTLSSDGTQLTINFMEIDMTGTYICEASLLSVPSEKVHNTVKIDVDGLFKPEITNYTIDLDENHIVAICRIKAAPKATISWHFKPQGSEVFSKISKTGEELKITELKLTDTGIYKCMAKNVLGKTKHEFNVTVQARPIIYNEDPNYYGVENDLVLKVFCNVTGFPEPIIVWHKEGKVLQTDSKYAIKGTTLYINKPVQSDSAKYTCEAVNMLGNATMTAFVNINDGSEDDVSFYGDTHEIFVNRELSKTLQCNLKYPEEDSVRWYMNKMLDEQTGSHFTIEIDSAIDDSSNYTCRVNTDEGSQSETYFVSFGYPPTFVDYDPEETVNWKRNLQKLDCEVDAVPSATYEWSHNEKAVLNRNGLSQLTITDWGSYTCQVSNVLGNISRTFAVTTAGCYITKNIAKQNQPLVSDKDTPTWLSSITNNGIILEKNEEIKLSCLNHPKSANTFKIIPGKNEITAKCEEQDKFSVDGITYRYATLQCNMKVEPSVLVTEEQCAGPNSEMLRVGFAVNGFLDAYEVCYDKISNVPLFGSASNQISRDIDGVDVTQFDWSFAPELPGTRNTEIWETKGYCYTRGQLVNVNDLGFGPAQAATFKYNLNFIPIWNPSCDHSTRRTWESYKDEYQGLSSWTGASEYADKDGGLVPRYLWKVLNINEDFYVMVYVNDKSPVESDIRCSAPTDSPCESMVEDDYSLYCCSFEDFKKIFEVSLNLDKVKVV